MIPNKKERKEVDKLEYLCPLCNGLIQYEKKCSKCMSYMMDRGRVQDYYDDYSPYLSYSITDIMDEEPANICQHIFACPVCEYDDVVNINKMYM